MFSYKKVECGAAVHKINFEIKRLMSSLEIPSYKLNWGM